ncbi:hypothetical protein KSP40_PGU013778 [Platanthera guangdongensis]|uniref:Uncharacterized protein n=1 Tax=Platanthera guangdongensis TaxID=2320717 RepID=A0ABR2LQ10_9ASPA
MEPIEDNNCIEATSYPGNLFPPPSTKSLINDGAISGVLPKTEVLSVHYPGYPSSTARAIETLSGLPKIAKAWSCALQSLGGTQDPDKDKRRFLELKFRPEDPYCHPAFGEPHPSSNLLLRISRPMNVNNTACSQQLSADVVAKVTLAYHFEGMADYQHVIAVHEAESRRKKRSWDDELIIDDDDMDYGDVMKLVPPLFARKDKPEKIVLNAPANLVSENLQKRAVEYYWEMDIEPCHAISFSIDKIPEKINWEDKLPKGNNEWDAQLAVSKLFEERPIWPRWSLHERLLDDGQEVSEYLLRRLLLRAGYYFCGGPFGKFWIRKGYDPRKNPDSRIYQKVDFVKPRNFRNFNAVNANSELKHKWKDICKFKVWPSKVSTCLQLFELQDDFIHQEIEKPTTRTTCAPSNGWFSETMIKSLCLHIKIRFMEIIPKEASEEFLKSTIKHFKRCRKKETLSMFWKPEKECNGNQDAIHHLELQNNSNNVEIEQAQNEVHPIDEEEDDVDDYEEDELDDYESSQMVGEDDDVEEPNLPGEYLQELLNGFPYGNNGKSHQLGEAEGGSGSSDDEYQIYEQDGDADYVFD